LSAMSHKLLHTHYKMKEPKGIIPVEIQAR